MTEQNDHYGNAPNWVQPNGSPYGRSEQIPSGGVLPPSATSQPSHIDASPQMPQQPMQWKEAPPQAYQTPQPTIAPTQPIAPSQFPQMIDPNIVSFFSTMLAQSNANQQAWIENCLKQNIDVLSERFAQESKRSTDEDINQMHEKLTEIETKMEELISAIQEIKKGNPSDKEVLEELAELKTRNIDVLRDFKSFQSVTAKNQQEELDKYHKLHSSTANIQILTEVARAYISARKAIENEEGEVRRRLVNLVLEPLEELLTEENGVVIQQTPEKETRSVRTCTTRKKIPTGDQSLHGTVAKSISPSFTLGTVVFLREVVDTYIYDPSLDISGKEVEELPQSSTDRDHASQEIRDDSTEDEASKNETIPPNESSDGLVAQ